MDKYEFNYKVDQLKKMVKQGEYETAMRIADSINWRRVHNTSLLSMVSEVYEKNGEYAEAKAVLELAFERSSKGQRILYKLTILSLKADNLEDAEEYYKEFYNEFPEDARNYVLRYLILKEKGAHVDQMILTLEKYVELELNEEWMYELAELYHIAGRSEDCIKTCDNIMLMFGLGQYVDKAIELKTIKEGVPLTEHQIGLMQNRDKYDERFKEISTEDLLSENFAMNETVQASQGGGQDVGNEVQSSEQYYSPDYDDTSKMMQGNQEYHPQEPQFGEPSQFVPASPVDDEDEEVYGRRFIPREEYTGGGYESYDDNPVQSGYMDEVDAMHDLNEDALNVVINGISQEYDEATDEEIYAQQAKNVEQADDFVQEEIDDERILANETVLSQQEMQDVEEYSEDEDIMIADSETIDMNQIDAGIDYEISEGEMDGSNVNEEQTIAQIDNIVEEEQIGRDIKAMGEDVKEVEDSEHDKTKILSNIRAALEARETSTVIYADATAGVESEKIHIVEGDLMIEDLDYEEPQESPNVFYKSAFVVVDSLDDALSEAAETLKEIYKVTGEVKPIAKINASKLNTRGVFASAERIGEKDLIIEGASDLDEQAVTELLELATRTDKSLIFVDTAEGIAYLKESYPQLGEICGKDTANLLMEEDDFEDVSDIILQDDNTTAARTSTVVMETTKHIATGNSDVEEATESDAASYDDAAEEDESLLDTDVSMSDPEHHVTSANVQKTVTKAREPKIFRGEDSSRSMDESEESEEDLQEEMEEEPDASMLEEMDIEAFVEYADNYATKIDCIITGNGINALFERAEIMEEDGILLNKLNAEALIEEVADRAERPGLLRRIASFFAKKYDKNGLLILKEEHFIS